MAEEGRVGEAKCGMKSEELHLEWHSSDPCLRELPFRLAGTVSTDEKASLERRLVAARRANSGRDGRRNCNGVSGRDGVAGGPETGTRSPGHNESKETN